VPFRQPAAAYIEQFHSTSALARERMPPGESAAFDRAIEKIVRPYTAGGMLELEAVAEVAWGHPTAADPPTACRRVRTNGRSM
jgi:hypothetical protein